MWKLWMAQSLFSLFLLMAALVWAVSAQALGKGLEEDGEEFWL